MAGKYGKTAGLSLCSDCDPGKYMTGSRASACSSCLPGKFSLQPGATSANVCEDCPAGKYAQSVGAFDCTKCGEGKYSSSWGSESENSCTECPADTSSTALGARSEDTCISCAAGKVAGSGSSSCSDPAASPATASLNDTSASTSSPPTSSDETPSAAPAAPVADTEAPTAAATEAPADTSFAVTLLVTMPYSKADFDAEKQGKYISAVAAAAATSIANIDIVAVTEALRRAESINVETKILAIDSAGVNALVSKLGTADALTDNINTELKKQGLRESTGVSSHFSASTDISSASSESSLSSWIPVIIGGSVGVVVIFAFAIFCIRRRQFASKTSQVLPVHEDKRQSNFSSVNSAQALHHYRDHAIAAQETEQTIIVEDIEDALEENINLEELMPCSVITSADLALPSEAEILKNSMFQNTFLADASSATLDGILAFGQRVPAIGVIFELMKGWDGEGMI